MQPLAASRAVDATPQASAVRPAARTDGLAPSNASFRELTMEWRCSRCTLSNPSSNMDCGACGAARYPPATPKSPATPAAAANATRATVVGSPVSDPARVPAPASPPVVTASASVKVRRPVSASTPAAATSIAAKVATAGPPPVDAKWVCLRCTFQNPLASLSCEMCETPQPQWRCSRCTLQNPPGGMVCTACSTLHPSLGRKTVTPPPAEPQSSIPVVDDHSSSLGGADRCCVVCLERPPTHCYVPCGHKVLCEICSALERTKAVCVVCRRPASALIRVYGD